MEKQATINDVAKYANVSTATVSRYLANNGYPIKEGTKNNIKNAIEILSYTPNIVGRMLKTSKSMDIGVIIPSIINPYYPTLITGIEKVAREKGYNILLCNSRGDIKLQKQYINMLIQKQVKGLIISTINQDEDLFKDIMNKGIDLVLLEDNINIKNDMKVLFNYRKGAYIAVEYLIKLGHKKIIFLTTPLTRKSRLDILDGYKQCLLDNNIKYNKVIETREENEFKNGVLLASKMLEEKEIPTAILAINDMAAFGIMQYLSQNGIRIPNDISIIGFDDLEISKMMNPALTTIRQPSAKTGEIAANMLFDMFANKDVKQVVLEPKLVIRASTNKIKGEI